MLNIDTKDLILHSQYSFGPIGTDTINILLPIGTEYWIGSHKFKVDSHQLTKGVDIETGDWYDDWVIEMIAIEIDTKEDPYTQLWRDTQIGKLDI